MCFVRVLGIRGLAGACKDNRGLIRTISSISFSIRGNRFITVINTDNDNGSALLRLVNNISHPADKGVFISNGSVDGVGSSGLTMFHHERINVICRFCGLVPVLAIRRGVALPYSLSNENISERELRVVLSSFKLHTEEGRLPGRLSNNRRREASVTETLVGGPSLILTSRPANGLSSGSDRRIVDVLGVYGRDCKRAIVVVARGLSVTGRTSEVVAVDSNGVIRRI